jgi:hypothetical protein
MAGDYTTSGNEPDALMNDENPPRPFSEVAMWHLLSGSPDNVTEDGEIVRADAALRQRSEKDLLRSAIEALSAVQEPAEVRSLTRLAASYLLAGDAETAQRYVNAARERLADQE